MREGEGRRKDGGWFPVGYLKVFQSRVRERKKSETNISRRRRRVATRARFDSWRESEERAEGERLERETQRTVFSFNFLPHRVSRALYVDTVFARGVQRRDTGEVRNEFEGDNGSKV